MKNNLFLLPLFLCILKCFTQEKGCIEYGINTGLNFAKVNVAGKGNTKSTIRFNLAASGEYYFSEKWGVKIKVIYDKNGWGKGFFTDEKNITSDTDYHLNYITIPLLANWHYGTNKNWYMHFGASASFLLNANLSNIKRDVSNFFNSTNYDILYGFGYKITIKTKTKLFIEYEDTIGLSKINMNNGFDSNPNITNRRSSLNLGLLFSIN